MSADPDPRPVRRTENDARDGVLTFPVRVEPEPTIEPLFRELAGRALREERTAQEKTLSQVAERAGLSPQYLSEVERGLKEPSSEMLASICGALGLRLADLLRAADRHLIGVTLRLSAASLSAVTSAPSGALLMAA